MPIALQDKPVRIETPRMVLREFAPADIPGLLIAFADAEIARWNPTGADPGSVAEFIDARNDWSSTWHASWAVADTEDRLVGSVSLHKIDPAQEDSEIGYWIAPWARRQGRAVEAVTAATRFAFDLIGLHRVYLYHAVENGASCLVARAAGYPLEGTLRQSFRYADARWHDEHLHGRLSDDDRADDQTR
ncbi:MAG: GNAT family N-acetyltransferase [Nocardioidaceae bacterium]